MMWIKEVSRKYEEVLEGAQKEIERIIGGLKVKYRKDFWKIRFESNYDL